MKSVITSYALASIDTQVSALVPTGGIWDDASGGIVCTAGAGSTFTGELALIKPDGHYIRGGRRSLTLTDMGYAYDGYLATRTSGQVGQRMSSLTLPIGTGHTLAATGSFAMLSDRFLHFTGKNVTYTTFAGSSGTAAVINAGGGTAGCIFPYDLSGGKNQWWLCDTGNGTLYLYDADAVAEIAGYRSSFGGAVVFATYSREQGVFGVVMASLPTTLKLFTNEPQAATISAPAFGSSVVVGIRNTISATVLGSDSEPCSNRAVTFSVDYGSIPVPTVLTNASGIATVNYEPPWTYVVSVTATATLVE